MNAFSASGKDQISIPGKHTRCSYVSMEITTVVNFSCVYKCDVISGMASEMTEIYILPKIADINICEISVI